MEFEPDAWIYVRAYNKEGALRFLGAPDNWPCEFDRFSTDPDKPGRIFRVKSDGLVIGNPDSATG